MLYENKILNGCMYVNADNITIKNVKIIGTSTCDGSYILLGFFRTGIIIEDVEIDGQGFLADGSAIGFAGYTCRRCHIHNTVRPFHLNHGMIVDSYTHNLVGVDTTHTQAILKNGGNETPTFIRHNNLRCDASQSCSSAVSFYNEGYAVVNVTLENNLLNGGGYCLYGGEGNDPNVKVPRNVRIINNRFGEDIFARNSLNGDGSRSAGCGTYGPLAYWLPGRVGSEFTGNVWHNDNSPFNP